MEEESEEMEELRLTVLRIALKMEDSCSCPSLSNLKEEAEDGGRGCLDGGEGGRKGAL